jgi:type I restriction enzyme S subunit
MSKLVDPVVLDTERRITDAGVSSISSGLLPVGTVLLSSRAPIGYTAITAVPLAINQGFIAMRCEKSLPNYFVLRWTRANMDEVEARAGGTTFAEISKSSFRPIPVMVPPRPVLAAFVERAGPWHELVVHNARESRTLAALRDAILPKLLSGEVRLKQAEKAVEAAL